MKLPIMRCFVSLKQYFCEITIFLPIGEKLVLIAGVVPIILIYSSSTGDLLSCSLIFLEDYDALLYDLFYVAVVDNERKTKLVHSHKNFTGEHGKYM